MSVKRCIQLAKGLASTLKQLHLNDMVAQSLAVGSVFINQNDQVCQKAVTRITFISRRILSKLVAAFVANCESVTRR